MSGTSRALRVGLYPARLILYSFCCCGCYLHLILKSRISSCFLRRALLSSALAGSPRQPPSHMISTSRGSLPTLMAFSIDQSSESTTNGPYHTSLPLWETVLWSMYSTNSATKPRVYTFMVSTRMAPRRWMALLVRASVPFSQAVLSRTTSR